MKKALVATAIAAGVGLSATACGPGMVNQANNSYCVSMTGQVMPPQYCQVGYPMYNPHMYDLWIGPTYGHSYGVGTVIQHNYFVSGKQVDPGNQAARRAAGIPVSGSVGNGTKATTTTKVPSSAAKAQQAPKSPSVPFSGGKTTTTTPKSTYTAPKTSGGFSSGRSSSSFGGFRSSGGRK